MIRPDVIWTLASCLSFSISISGCAAIFSGNSQEIRIYADETARMTRPSDSTQAAYHQEGYFTLSLPKSNRDTVRVAIAGKTTSITIRPEINPLWTLADFAAAPPVGFFIDNTTGKWNEFRDMVLLTFPRDSARITDYPAYVQETSNAEFQEKFRRVGASITARVLENHRHETSTWKKNSIAFATQLAVGALPMIASFTSDNSGKSSLLARLTFSLAAPIATGLAVGLTADDEERGSTVHAIAGALAGMSITLIASVTLPGIAEGFTNNPYTRNTAVSTIVTALGTVLPALMAVQWYNGSRPLLYAVQGTAPVAMLDIDSPESTAAISPPAFGMDTLTFDAVTLPIMRLGLVNLHW